MEFDGEVIKFNIFDAMRFPTDVHNVNALDVYEKLSQNVFELDNDDVLNVVVTHSLSSTELTKYDYVLCDESVDAIYDLKSLQSMQPLFKLLNKSCVKTFSTQDTIVKPKLKPLPANLKYVYLGDNETLPVIVSNSLTEWQEKKLIRFLIDEKSA